MSLPGRFDPVRSWSIASAATRSVGLDLYSSYCASSEALRWKYATVKKRRGTRSEEVGSHLLFHSSCAASNCASVCVCGDNPSQSPFPMPPRLCAESNSTSRSYQRILRRLIPTSDGPQYLQNKVKKKKKSITLKQKRNFTYWSFPNIQIKFKIHCFRISLDLFGSLNALKTFKPLTIVALCHSFWPSNTGQMELFQFIFIPLTPKPTFQPYCSLCLLCFNSSPSPSSFQQDSSRVQGEWRVTGAGGSSMSGPCIFIRLTALMFLWKWLTLSLLQTWVSVGAEAADPAGAGFSGSTGPLGWLLSDKGPFHHSQEFVDFTERYQQGFTTKYKIYRWERVHGLQSCDACEEGCLWNLNPNGTKGEHAVQLCKAWYNL